MFKLGLTGGIATGKSTVANYLKTMGIPVIDADVTAREVVEPGQPALLDIVAEFGPQMLQADGSLNRAELGKIVFSDPQKLARLNAITHPRIAELTQIKQHEYEEKHTPLVVFDVPLMFEVGKNVEMDQVMVVTVPKAIQLERLIKRNQLTPSEANQRIEAQMPLSAKAALADYIIHNDGTEAETQTQVQAILNQLPISLK
ncbi:MAG: dephospho-CoA kinase [Lactobacillaceae bacterium]|jgi:dephospho-CoA kinase|nr:dephospho-CoA kinase [Lactobacillaceae bacterium]